MADGGKIGGDAGERMPVGICKQCYDKAHYARLLAATLLEDTQNARKEFEAKESNPNAIDVSIDVLKERVIVYFDAWLKADGAAQFIARNDYKPPFDLGEIERIKASLKQ